MMNRYLVTILLALLPVLAIGKMVDVERTTTGYGMSYNEALNAAILEAVQQVRGMEIGTEKSVKFDLQQSVSGRTDVTTASMGVEQNIYAKSKGWVKSYKVLSTKKPSGKGGSWEVIAKVVVPRFESNAVPNDKRFTLAVMPFRVSRSLYYVDKSSIGGREASTRIQEAIQEKLTQSRRFAVVNRSFSSEFHSEKALLESENVSAVEASRLGQVAGADFMIVGRLHSLGASPDARNSYYGAELNKGEIRAEITYQVIEVPTQKVAWTDVLKLDVKPESEFDLHMLFDQVGKRVAKGTLEVIYPIKVLDIQSAERVYLTQGGEVLSVGDRLSVRGKGKTVVDPDTGMKIPLEGPIVAQVEVVEVMPKYSVAKLVEGDLNEFSANSVLRPMIDAIEASMGQPKTPGSSSAPLRW